MEPGSNIIHQLYESLFGWTHSQAAIDRLVSTGARVLLILVGTFVVRRVLHKIADRYRRSIEHDGITEEEKRLATLASLAKTAISFLVLFVGVTMILNELHVSIGPILASAGVLGLAVGFGAQNLVRDVMSGFFVLLENWYREGDVIEVAGVSGAVERFGLRATVLRDQQGRVHYIPNGEIKLVSNLTQEWSQAQIDIGVAYKEDIDRVIAVLERLCQEMQKDPIYGPRITETDVMGIERLDDSAVVLRVTLRTQPLERWAVAREFRRRLLKTFRAEKIETPFPHLTIFMGSDQMPVPGLPLAGSGGSPAPPLSPPPAG
jgi:moderate conductance mechanosensitive channel